MKINPINISFAARSKVNLGEVKALNDLDLDDVYVSSQRKGVKEFNQEKTPEARDEFIMSQVKRASDLAEAVAKENPDASFDDVFQDIMLEVIKYANGANSTIDRRTVDNKMRRVAQAPQEEPALSIYVVKPSYDKDMLELISE